MSASATPPSPSRTLRDSAATCSDNLASCLIRFGGAGALGAVGSAPRSHRGGQEFKSPRVHKPKERRSVERRSSVWAFNAVLLLASWRSALGRRLPTRCGPPPVGRRP